MCRGSWQVFQILFTGVLISSLSCVVALRPISAAAQSEWNLSGPTPGDWNDGTNWKNGVPGPETSALVDNGGTALLQDPATVNNLTIGLKVAGSTVEVARDGNLYVGGNLLIGPEGTLLLSGGVLTADSIQDNGEFVEKSATGYTDGIPVAGSGTFVQSGSGTVVVLANNTYTGGTTINAGALQIGDGHTAGSIVGNVTDNASLVFDRSDNLAFAGSISGSGSVTQNGTGTLTLSGQNSYAGGTNILGGVLSVDNDGNLGAGGITIRNNGELLTTGANFTTNKAINLGAGGGTLATVGGSSATYGGIISGTGPLHIGDPANGGAVILTANNSYSGGTSIDRGTLQLGNGGTSGSITGNVTDNGTLAFDRSDVVTFDGVISGTGTVEQNGTGATILTGTNTYTGGTTINAGRLQIGNGGTTGSIVGNVTDNLSLVFDRSDNVAFAGSISGPGSVTQIGTGTLTLSGKNSYAGETNILNGVLSVNNDGNLGAGGITIRNNGELLTTGTDFATNKTIILGAGGGTLATVGGSSATYRGIISGTGPLHIGDPANGGTVILTANNSYSGGTSIAHGTLQLGNGGTSGSITGNVTDNGTLAFDRSDVVIFDGVISGAGSVQQNGAGTTILAGTNTYTGGTTINAGTLQIGNGGTVGSIVGNVTDNASLVFDRSDNLAFAGSISGPGSLTQIGTGTLTLSGQNSYTGGTNILNGVLSVNNDGNIGAGGITIRNNGELLTTGTNFTTNKTINLGAGGGTLATVGGSSATYGGIVSGASPLHIGDPANGGTVILTANNNYSGGTSIDRGTLQLGNGGTSGSIAGNITDNGTLAFNRSDVVTFGGVINGTGSVQQNGTGTTILTGTNTYSGGTNIASGTLVAGSGTPFGSGPVQISGNASLLEIPNDVTVTAGPTNIIAGTADVNGTLNVPSVSVQPGATLMGSGFINCSLTNSGTVSPGNSPGTLTIRGNYTQTSSGVLNIVINSATNYSHLAVTGHANLDGTLRLTLASGFKPNASGNFQVLSAGQGISGSFRSIVDPSGPPFRVSYTNGAVDVTAADPQKSDPAFRPSDGTPSSTTALISNQIFFNNLGSLAGRDAAGTDRPGAKQNNAIGLTFDAGEFRLQGQTGHTYGFPIAGQYKFSDRVALDYEIPFEYVELPGSNFFQTGAILNLPLRVVVGNDKQPFSWGVTPSAALASTGSKEITGAGALSNVLSYRWHNITFTYGNYISFFEGATLVSNDPQFPKGTSQQILKNGLKTSIPVGKDWLFEAYGIYTNFLESAPVSSYYTIGAELGRHITYNSAGRTLDLGYYSVGFYTEQGNHYSSSHIQFGTAWRF